MFELHIRPMFRATDRDHMEFALDLWDYGTVRGHADEVLGRLETDMPTRDTGGPWPDEWVALFKRWMQTGFKRLELGSADYTLTRSASAVTIRAVGTFPAAGCRGWLQLETEDQATKTYVLYVERPDEPVAGDPATFNMRERYGANDIRSVSITDSSGLHRLEAGQP